MPENLNEEKPVQPMDPDVEANKTVAALSYISILFIIPLLGKKDSKFCQFHAKQGLVVFLIELLASILCMIPPLCMLVWLGAVVLSVLAVMKVLNGEWWKIPYIYDWAQKFNL